MICQFACEAVVSGTLSDDARVAKVVFKSGEDTVNVVVPGPQLDDLIDKLCEMRDAVRAAGVDRSDAFQHRLPKSYSVGALRESPGNVVLAFDRSLPSRVGFVLGAAASRSMGRKMIEAARAAEELTTRSKVDPNRRVDA